MRDGRRAGWRNMKQESKRKSGHTSVTEQNNNWCGVNWETVRQQLETHILFFLWLLSRSVSINNSSSHRFHYEPPLLRDKLHQPQPSCYQVTVVPSQRLRDSCLNGDNVTQGHLKLICNAICNMGQCVLQYVSHVFYRSGRGWRPSSTCVQSTIMRTTQRSWPRWWGAGCWEALQGPAPTLEAGCPFMEQTEPRGGERTMRRPRERSPAAQRAHTKR